MAQRIQRGTYPRTNPISLQLNDRARKLLAGKRIADALDFIAYDTLRFKAGAAVPVGDLFFFTSGLGQTVSIANSVSEQYLKTKADTNLQDGNRLPAGQCLIVDSIEMTCWFSGSTDTTYPTSGVGAEEPTDTTAAAAISATNIMSAVLRQSYINSKLERSFTRKVHRGSSRQTSASAALPAAVHRPARQLTTSSALKWLSSTVSVIVAFSQFNARFQRL